MLLAFGIEVGTNMIGVSNCTSPLGENTTHIVRDQNDLDYTVSLFAAG
jgi:hypothetical protein